jgi:hypothetical protein
MPYTPTVWVNGSSPYMNQTNLRKLRDELASQATSRSISHSLPVWTDGTTPYLTDASPWQEMERVAAAVAASLLIAEYEQTKWFPGWAPPRNATNLNRLEAQAQANRSAIDNLNPNYPSSFYTGPLGANNILPAVAGEKFIGAMTGGDGYTVTQQRSRIASMTTAMGRSYDIIQAHYDGGGIYGGVYGCEDPTDTLGAAPGGVTHEQYAINNGAIPAVSWSPDYTIAEVNAGDADQIYTKMGDYFKTYKPTRIMLRIFHELDGYFIWAVNGPGGPYTAGQFISAWQRAVDTIRGTGADNVGFWWCPNEGPSMGRTGLSTYYPGDTYVDWVGSDWYNVVHSQSTPFHTGWAEWWELFNYGQYPGSTLWSQYDIYGGGIAVSGQRGWTGTPHVKPFVVGETSSIFDPPPTAGSGDSTKKGNWFRNVVDHANGIASMDNAVGVVFFDSDVHGQPGNYNWQVDSDADVSGEVGSPHAGTLQGYVDLANDPVMGG